MEEDWTIDANEALNISLVQPTPSGIEQIASFKPRFTYAIFGQEERIFGHKGLKINLQYDARDMRPNLSVSSSRKFVAVDNVEATDVKLVMKEFLPGVAFQSKQEFDHALKALPSTWTPPGTLVRSFHKNGEEYGIWYGTLDQPEIRQLVKRIQVMVLFYIEGGSFAGVDSDGNDEPDYSLARWSVFFVYKMPGHPKPGVIPQYTFQGYATAYNYWVLIPDQRSPDERKELGRLFELHQSNLSLRELPHRVRISQFLILPPFQGKGIGACLYDAIYSEARSRTSVVELTVEDPNEDFDLLRDLCDLKRLRAEEFKYKPLRINTDVQIPEKGGILHHDTHISPSISSSAGIIDLAMLERTRAFYKIAPRQFWRLIELQLMSTLPDSVRPRSDVDYKKPPASKADKHAYVLWRLLLKQRLYRRNVSILAEFDITERIIKLNETVENVEWEYSRILDRLESSPNAASNPAVAKDKRRLSDAAGADSLPNKKVRGNDA